MCALPPHHPEQTSATRGHGSPGSINKVGRRCRAELAGTLGDGCRVERSSRAWPHLGPEPLSRASWGLWGVPARRGWFKGGPSWELEAAGARTALTPVGEGGVPPVQDQEGGWEVWAGV